MHLTGKGGVAGWAASYELLESDSDDDAGEWHGKGEEVITGSAQKNAGIYFARSQPSDACSIDCACWVCANPLSTPTA
jgi:hypothetical protein